LEPRHERVIVRSSPVFGLPQHSPHIALRLPILSFWQIKENRFGNVPLIIVNALFTSSGDFGVAGERAIVVPTMRPPLGQVWPLSPQGARKPSTYGVIDAARETGPPARCMG